MADFFFCLYAISCVHHANGFYALRGLRILSAPRLASTLEHGASKQYVFAFAVSLVGKIRTDRSFQDGNMAYRLLEARFFRN